MRQYSFRVSGNWPFGANETMDAAKVHRAEVGTARRRFGRQAPQHFLYFLLPQGQRSFRPGLTAALERSVRRHRSTAIPAPAATVKVAS